MNRSRPKNELLAKKPHLEWPSRDGASSTEYAHSRLQTIYSHRGAWGIEWAETFSAPGYSTFLIRMPWTNLIFAIEVNTPEVSTPMVCRIESWPISILMTSWDCSSLMSLGNVSFKSKMMEKDKQWPSPNKIIFTFYVVRDGQWRRYFDRIVCLLQHWRYFPCDRRTTNGSHYSLSLRRISLHFDH